MKIVVRSKPGYQAAALIDGGELVAFAAESLETRSRAIDIYMGRVVKVVPGLQAAFVEIGAVKPGFLHASDLLLSRPAPDTPMPPIESLLKVGNEVMLQIKKETNEGKGPRMTRRIQLPGVRVVLALGRDEPGVSRKIEDPSERARLSELLEACAFADKLGHQVHFVARTSAAACTGEELRSECDRLGDRWRALVGEAEQGGQPRRLYRDARIAERFLRDHVRFGVSEIWVDTDSDRIAIERVLSDELKIEYRPRVSVREGDLFADAGVPRLLERVSQPRVSLPSGGEIVIQPTEAFTVVDVNSGHDIRGHDAQETLLRVNLEAMKVVARQVKLRNLSGLIVIDTVDLLDEAARARVEQTLRDCLAHDRDVTAIEPISALGLLHFARRRTRPPVHEVMGQRCEPCLGTGRVV